ncbi:hypothetical protein AB3S75_023488 [Citrus x aurantiifolia]
MPHLKPIKVISVVDEEPTVLQNREENQPLSPMARMFHQPESNVYIVTMIGFKSKINPEVVKANLEHSLLKHHRFSSLQVVDEKIEGGLKWVPTKVNLDDHVIVPNLEPKLIDSPDKFVEDYTSSLSQTGIKMSMPMWDLHLLNIKTSDAESVAVLRVHHSLGDTKTPLKGELGNGCLPRRFVHRSVSLDDVKLVKNAMNTTINDVMLGVTQAGLSRYLNRKYGQLNIINGLSERNNNLPNNIRLRATFFMNLRPSAGIQELANMLKKDSKAKWGNQIGYLIFPFTIALRDDPLDYLREAKVAMDRKKASLEASFSYFLSKSFLKFGNKAASFPSETTLWFSNVMGPKEEISLYGYPIAYVAPSCSGQPNGLMIHVVSYANKMTFVLSVDDGLIPDPHQLCDDLEESLHLIKNASLLKDIN